MDAPHAPANPGRLTVLSNPETGERLFFGSLREATEHLNIGKRAATTAQDGRHRTTNDVLIGDPTKKELNELTCAVTLYDAAIGHRRVFPTVVSAAKFVGVPVQAFLNVTRGRAGDNAMNGWRVFDSERGGPASNVKGRARLTVLHNPETNERLFFDSMADAAKHLGIGRSPVETARRSGALVNGRLVVDATKKELDGISRLGGQQMSTTSIGNALRSGANLNGWSVFEADDEDADAAAAAASSTTTTGRKRASACGRPKAASSSGLVLDRTESSSKGKRPRSSIADTPAKTQKLESGRQLKHHFGPCLTPQLYTTPHAPWTHSTCDLCFLDADWCLQFDAMPNSRLQAKPSRPNPTSPRRTRCGTFPSAGARAWRTLSTSSGHGNGSAGWLRESMTLLSA